MLTGTEKKTKPITADRVVSTTCPYCGVGCTLQLHVKDDFIYRVTSPFRLAGQSRQPLRQRPLRL